MIPRLAFLYLRSSAHFVFTFSLAPFPMFSLPIITLYITLRFHFSFLVSSIFRLRHYVIIFLCRALMRPMSAMQPLD